MISGGLRQKLAGPRVPQMEVFSQAVQTQDQAFGFSPKHDSSCDHQDFDERGKSKLTLFACVICVTVIPEPGSRSILAFPLARASFGILFLYGH